MNFEESVNYLLSLGNEVLAMKLGLENIGKLLAALGDPQNNYYKVQVAGTNGKGSTCAFLESICLEAGIRVGLTTSPHLVSVTERVKINGEEISEEDFARLATEIREVSESLVDKGTLESVPTHFEQVTAIAMLAFAEADVRLVILETGLGGRFDATTAARAEVAVITPIDYDHQAILGETLAEIAAEKAAIIRENSAVVVAPQGGEAENVIRERIKSTGALQIPVDLRAEIVRTSDRGKYVVDFLREGGEYRNVTLNLRGAHQIENTLTAVITAEFLALRFQISKEEIIAGLENAVHRGRLEFNDGFLLDGAHNASGARALRSFLDEFVRPPVTLIFGSMRDKDLAEITKTLFPAAAHLILTRSANARSLDVSELRRFVPAEVAQENIIVTDTVEEAIRAARKISSPGGTICVTGSLYLVGEAQKLLNNEKKI